MSDKGSDHDDEAKLLAKLALGIVFVREELAQFPAAVELLETMVALLKTRGFSVHEAPTKPKRKETPPLGTASGSFQSATKALREVLQSGKRTQEIPQEEIDAILKKRPTKPGLGER